MFSKLTVPRFKDVGSTSTVVKSPRKQSPSPTSFKRSASSIRSAKDTKPRAKSSPTEDDVPKSPDSKKKGSRRGNQVPARSSSLDRPRETSVSRKPDRQLKKTSSMIPRATSQKMRPPSSKDDRRPQTKKSDVSVKVRKVVTPRAKKLERKRSSQTAVILKSKSVHSSTSGETSDLKKPQETEKKPKSFLKVNKVITQARKKPSTPTAKDFQQEEELKVVEIGNFSQNNINPKSTTSPIAVKFNSFNSNNNNNNHHQTAEADVDFTEFQKTFESQVLQIPEIWMNVATILSSARDDVLTWISEKRTSFDPSKFEAESESLRYDVENAKINTKLKTEELLIQIKKLFISRETFKSELKIINEGMAKEYKEALEKLKDCNEQLEKEKARASEIHDRKSALEEANHALKEKNKETEKIFQTQEAKITELAAQIKNLKQRDAAARGSNISQKSKDGNNLLKSKTELVKILELRITELTNEHTADKKEYEKTIADLEANLEDETQKLQAERELADSLRNSLKETEDRLEKIRAKKKDLSELVEKSKMSLQSQSEMTPSKREEELWTELEATKIVVKGYQDQISKLHEERNKMLLKFHQLCEDSTNEQSERMAAEIIRKDDIIKAMKSQITELQRTCEDHNSRYDKLQAQLREFQERIQEGRTDPVSLSKQITSMKTLNNDLQQQVNDLMMHNEELEMALAKRNLEIDQRDKLVKQQVALLSVRDELIALLRSKDDNQSQGARKVNEHDAKWEKKTEKIFIDLQKKSQNLDEMYNILQEKQNQVDRLSKIVKTMEEQQDRAQKQRVTFEAKIAELQKQLLERKPRSINKSHFPE